MRSNRPNSNIWKNFLNEKYFPKSAPLVKAFSKVKESNPELDNTFELFMFTYANPDFKKQYLSTSQIKNGIREGFREEFLDTIAKNDGVRITQLVSEINQSGYGIIVMYYNYLGIKNDCWLPLLEYVAGCMMTYEGFGKTSVYEEAKIFLRCIFEYGLGKENGFKIFANSFKQNPKKMVDFFISTGGFVGNTANVGIWKTIDLLDQMKLGNKKDKDIIEGLKQLTSDYNEAGVDYNVKVFWEDQGIRNKTYAELGFNIALNLGIKEIEDNAIKALQANDYYVRESAIDYLRVCGTSKDLKSLQIVAKTDPYYVIENGVKVYPLREFANEAIGSIKSRGGK